MIFDSILMAHNYYQYRGGEDESFESEKSMLVSKGHTIATFVRTNEEINISNAYDKFKLFLKVIWSSESYHAIQGIIKDTKPKVAHFQNIFPLITPAVYYACKDAGIPVVQTLRNYRLVCANGYLLRNSVVCEDCIGKIFPWPAIVHSCYRSSKVQSLAVASMLYYHRIKKSWDDQVDLYICLSEFSRKKFIEAGIKPEKVVVKPNYVPDPGLKKNRGDYLVYIGRLSSEKGIYILLQALKKLPSIKSVIVGDGPLKNSIHRFVTANAIDSDIRGHLEREVVVNIIRSTRILVYPSLLYETFGRVIIEAFAAGVPVIAARMGAMAELIRDGENGLLFSPGDSQDLAVKIDWLWNHPAEQERMGLEGRKDYENKFTLDKNYELLMEIYEQAVEMNKRS